LSDPGPLHIDLGGVAFEPLPQKALWCPGTATLLVADVHIGKAQTFRTLGVPVPTGTTGDTLDRLEALMQWWRPRRVVFLGDLLHSAHARHPRTLQALAQWRERQAGVELVLVRGNHDSRAGDPPAALDVHCVDEPFELAPGVALSHHPEPRDGVYVLAGHLHPCTHVGRGFERLRLPCFHFGARVGVLPAFGAFTGMHPIARDPGDRVVVVADNAVRLLP
jgi:uncharacterized protein